MIILRNKNFGWFGFGKRQSIPPSEEYPHNDGNFTVQELKADKKVLEKFIYEIEKPYLPERISERDFIIDLVKERDDKEGITIGLNPHSRLISSSIYSNSRFWSFDKFPDGTVAYSGSGD